MRQKVSSAQLFARKFPIGISTLPAFGNFRIGDNAPLEMRECSLGEATRSCFKLGKLVRKLRLESGELYQAKLNRNLRTGSRGNVFCVCVKMGPSPLDKSSKSCCCLHWEHALIGLKKDL